MNIAVTGEGVTDYGQQVFGEDKWEEGPVHARIRCPLPDKEKWL